MKRTHEGIRLTIGMRSDRPNNYKNGLKRMPSRVCDGVKMGFGPFWGILKPSKCDPLSGPPPYCLPLPLKYFTLWQFLNFVVVLTTKKQKPTTNKLWYNSDRRWFLSWHFSALTLMAAVFSYQIVHNNPTGRMPHRRTHWGLQRSA